MEQVQSVLAILDTVVLGNTLKDWLLSVASFSVMLLLLQFFRKVVLNKLNTLVEHVRFGVANKMMKILKGISWPLYFFSSLFVASQMVLLPDLAEKVILGIFVIVLAYDIINILEKILEYMILHFWLGAKEGDEQMAGIVRLILRIVLWSVGMLMVLSNLGVDVTSLIASLGIGGIAIALAVQNVLSDMFSSFSIYLDEPFKIGDFIIVGEHKGTVKHIGLKTTRIKALQGEEIVISNAELTSSRVRNFKKMERRRIEFFIGVEYGTPLEKLKKLPQIISAIMESEPLADPDRVHFQSFGDFSLKYEIVYFLKTADYTEYMNTQQSINFKIVEAFEKEGIQMAFPTQTIHIAKE